MKRKSDGFLSLYFLAPVLLVPMLSCGSLAAEGEKASSQENGQTAGERINREIVLPQDITARPVEKELGPGAKETYAYLLFIKSILDEDEAGLLEAAPLLAQSPAPASVWLDGGVWLMSRKSPNSVVFLENALKSHPNDLSLNLLYAEALGDHGMASRGIQMMREFLKKHPDEMDARMELALLLVKDRQFAEAQKMLAQISPKQRTPLVEYYQAKALTGMDKRAEAIPYLRRAVKGMPDFVEALAELAYLYEREENWKEARAAYEKLQKLNFSPTDVALRLVNLSLRMKQPEKAVQYIKQGPDSIPFRLTAANLLVEARHYLQAEAILKQLASRKDAPPEVYMLLADVVYEQRHNLSMALSWLDKIPDNSPGKPRAEMLRLQLMAEDGKTEKALAAAEEAVKRFPDKPELRDFQIRLLARSKKMNEALKEARAALALWPDNVDIRFLYGSLLDETGDKKGAMAEMEDILKKAPDNFQAMNYVGFTLAEENKDLDRALKLLEKANELSPNQAYIVDSLAWALFRSGKGAEALKQIRRAISLDANIDAAIWEHYGDIARHQGKKEEARKAYRRALELKPANAAQLKGKISKL